MTQAGTSCSYSLSPAAASAGAGGLSGNFNVTATAGCAWSATSNANWITITSGASGSGSASVGYSVAATSSARTGTVTVGGQTFTVTQSGTGGGTAASLLGNPGFESGAAAWTQSASGGYPIITNDTTWAGHSGSSYYAWLGGYDDGSDTIYQDVSIPASAQSAYVQFWYQIGTDETTATDVYDYLTVDLYNPTSGSKLATLKTLSNLNATNGWVQSAQFDVSAYKGQIVRLRFDAVTDSSYPTSFLIDDVTLTASNGAGTLPSTPTGVTAAAGNGSVSVAFTPGAIGSGTLVNYTATCGVGSVFFYGTGTSSPIVVTGLSNGTTYSCWVNTTSTVGTSSWSNASNSVTPTVATLADLMVSTLGAPGTGVAGQQITVTATVVNNGGASTGAYRLGFYFSTNATITTYDTLFASCSMPALAPGQSWSC